MNVCGSAVERVSYHFEKSVNVLRISEVYDYLKRARVSTSRRSIVKDQRRAPSGFPGEPTMISKTWLQYRL